MMIAPCTLADMFLKAGVIHSSVNMMKMPVTRLANGVLALQAAGDGVPGRAGTGMEGIRKRLVHSVLAPAARPGQRQRAGAGGRSPHAVVDRGAREGASGGVAVEHRARNVGVAQAPQLLREVELVPARRWAGCRCMQ